MPSDPRSAEEREWWSTYEPVVGAWLREAVQSDVEDMVQMMLGATTLVGVPSMRASRRDAEARPPYSWDEIDAYEILFEVFARGGVPDPRDARTIVRAIRSFASYLVRRGFIERAAGAELERDLDRWMPRVLAFCEGGPWWTRTGPITS